MQSPFFTGGAGGLGLGPGFGSLAKAFIPEPVDTARIVAAQASAGYDNARTGEIGARRSAFNALGDRLQQGGVSPDVLRGIIAEAARTGDTGALANADQILRAYGFSQPGTTQAQRDQLFMGAGGSADNTETGRDMRNQTVRRGQDIDSGDRRFGITTRDATDRFGITTRDATDRFGITEREAGADRRFTVNVPAGQDVYVPGNSPVAPRRGAGLDTIVPVPEQRRGPNGAGNVPDTATRDLNAAFARRREEIMNNPNMTPREQASALDAVSKAHHDALKRLRIGDGRLTVPVDEAGGPARLRGQPTRDTTIADEIRPYIQGGRPDDAPGAQDRRQEIVAPTPAAAETRAAAAANKPGQQRPPIEIGGADAKAIDDEIGKSLPDSTVLDTAAAQVVRARAAQIWQETRNLPLAAQQAVKEFLAAQPNESRSFFGMGGTRTLSPAAAPPAAPTAGGAPAPPAGNVPRVRNAAEWQALPPGTQYIDPNGVPRVKGGS